MKSHNVLLGLVATLALTGCQMLDSLWCRPNCQQSSTHSSSSLVGFLYPGGGAGARFV